MEEFTWRYCDEEDTIGLLDVTLNRKVKEYFEENKLNGKVEWLEYYTRFLCEETSENIAYLEELERYDRGLIC